MIVRGCRDYVVNILKSGCCRGGGGDGRGIGSGGIGVGGRCTKLMTTTGAVFFYSAAVFIGRCVIINCGSIR